VIITPVAHGLEDLLGKSTAYRSPGLHMSEIYNDLYQDLEPKRYVRGSAPDPLRLEAGLAFEEILEEGLKKRLAGERPGEFTTEEGIIFSPDLIIFNSEIRLGEIKLTWLSTKEVPREQSNSFPPKFDKYFTQMRAYCYHLKLDYARLLAFFVNGNYRPPKPELLAWDIEFTARELRENWQMLLNHARSKPYLRERLQ
jgi:hypothetical protein